jgi:uncharacterized protein (TIGR02001 family)
MPNNHIKKIVLTMLTSTTLIFCSALANADEAAPEKAMEPAEKAADTATQPSPEAPAEKAAEAKDTETKEPEPPWDLSFTLNFVSDYRARGISQTWFVPTVQGSIDLTHKNGFYTGFWASNTSNDATAGAQQEINIYAGFNGDISAVEGLGYTTGLYGYIYPSGSYRKFTALTNALEVLGRSKSNETYDTYEIMGGLTYKWLTARAWVTLSDFYGQNKKTGWTRSTRGSTYFELAADVPLPFWGLDLIAGVGRTHVPGEVSADPDFLEPNSDLNGNLVRERKVDYTDYRIGISKSVEVKETATFTTSLTYIGATNSGSDDYWGKNGYGGSSVIPGNPGRNIGRDTVVLNIGVTF